jgi:hypothetical protein
MGGPALTPERIVLKASPEPNTGCWLWTGFDNGRGYGRIELKGRGQQAHRVIYEMLKGPIPPGHELDHLCRVTFCVNPDHLEPVPHRVNVCRGTTGAAVVKRQTAKTHCPRGHEYAGHNLVVHKDGSRHCRKCRREHDKASRRRRKMRKVLEAHMGRFAR